MLIVTGLLIQATALVLLFCRLKRTWLSHIGAIFIVIAVSYHGVNEILLWAFPGHDIYRAWFSPEYLGEFVIWISLAILLCTVTYLWALGRHDTQVTPHATNADLRRITRFFDWKVMLLVAAPLVVLSVNGQGYLSNGSPQGTSGVGVSAGLAQQFLLFALVLAGFGFVIRFGSRWMLPVLLIECGVVALLGQRAVVIWAGALTLYAFGRFGMRFTRRGLLVGIVILSVMALGITSARAEEGRFSTPSGGATRAQFLATGFAHIASAQTMHELAQDLGHRLDGNSFGAMELAAFASGQPHLGLTPLKNDVLLAIPSFLNPNKDSTDIGTRQEQIYAEEHLGLVRFQVAPTVWNNSLPTQLGITVGYFGPWGMLLAALLFGFAFGRADRWLRRGFEPARLLVGLGLLYCVMDYEGSLDTYTVTFRGILLLLMVVWAVKGMRVIAHGFGASGLTHPDLTPADGSTKKGPCDAVVGA